MPDRVSCGIGAASSVGVAPAEAPADADTKGPATAFAPAVTLNSAGSMSPSVGISTVGGGNAAAAHSMHGPTSNVVRVPQIWQIMVMGALGNRRDTPCVPRCRQERPPT